MLVFRVTLSPVHMPKKLLFLLVGPKMSILPEDWSTSGNFTKRDGSFQR